MQMPERNRTRVREDCPASVLRDRCPTDPQPPPSNDAITRGGEIALERKRQIDHDQADERRHSLAASGWRQVGAAHQFMLAEATSGLPGLSS